MHLIAYVSTCTVPENELDKAISDIISVAKIENEKRGITGVLFFHDHQFLQIIEGDEDKLRQLMINIQNDNRHVSVEYLVDKPVHERGFSQWNMDSFRLGVGKKFDRQILANLTRCYDKSLLPGAEKLLLFYKTLLEEQQVAI